MRTEGYADRIYRVVLNPFPLPEEQEQTCNDEDNYHPHKDIAVFPVEFRHELEIHPVKTYDKRRRKQDSCEDRQEFNNLIRSG